MNDASNLEAPEVDLEELLLRQSEPQKIEEFARAAGWLAEGENLLSVERAGEGNMNLVLRLVSDRQSVVLKQSRPWVEKYKTIPAPFDRALVEKAFYERIRGLPSVAASMPRLLGSDDRARVLLFEDLGVARDLTSLYGDEVLLASEAETLGDWIGRLHHGTRGLEGASALLANREMRELNHEHLFVVPLDAGNGLELDAFEPRLEETARRLQGDPKLAEQFALVGRQYLADGPCLLHGDYYPGSWLRTDRGLRVIDPEFGFLGPAEFDLAVAVAHLVLARHDRDIPATFLAAARAVSAGPLDEELLARFAGVEVIRRLIGVAQLPIAPTRGWRSEMLERARLVVISGSLEAFKA